MTVTCTLCQAIIKTVPIVGADEEKNFNELIQALRKHTFEKHKKHFEDKMKEALGQIAQIEGVCMAMVSMGLFTSSEPEYFANMDRGYKDAAKLFEGFRPKPLAEQAKVIV